MTFDFLNLFQRIPPELVSLVFDHLYPIQVYPFIHSQQFSTIALARLFGEINLISTGHVQLKKQFADQGWMDFESFSGLRLRRLFVHICNCKILQNPRFIKHIRRIFVYIENFECVNCAELQEFTSYLNKNCTDNCKIILRFDKIDFSQLENPLVLKKNILLESWNNISELVAVRTEFSLPFLSIRNLNALKNLRRLSLSNCNIDDLQIMNFYDVTINLVELDLSSNKVTDINQFTYLTNLEVLNLDYNNIQLLDLDTLVISGFLKLRELSIAYNCITKIFNIKNFDRLLFLDLNANEISVFENAYNLPSLTCLNLSQNPIEVFQVADNCLYDRKNVFENLAELSLFSSGLSFVPSKFLKVLFPRLKGLFLEENLLNGPFDFFESLHFLRDVDLSYNKIDEIILPSRMDKDLKFLSAKNNIITKVTNSFEFLINLVELNLDNNSDILKNNRNNLITIRSLTNLKTLSLNNVGVEKIDFLPSNPENQLQELFLNFNKISVIENLNQLMQLRKLSLHNNKIRKIENLKGLARLTHLNISLNQITHLENIQCLTTLYELNISHNKILESDNFSNMNYLTVVKAVGSHFSDWRSKLPLNIRLITSTNNALSTTFRPLP